MKVTENLHSEIMEVHGEAGSFPPNIFVFLILNTVLHKEPIFSVLCIYTFMHVCIFYLHVSMIYLCGCMHVCMYVCMYALDVFKDVLCRGICVVIGQPFAADCLLHLDMHPGD